MTEEDQAVAIRRLRALLNPKTIDGSLRVADTLSRHPEQFELLFDRLLDWTKADGMELRGAWHRMLSLRPELVGAFLAKLETIAPIHSQVISSETLFEEPVGKQVMAGMARWERLAGEAGMRQVLLDMTNWLSCWEDKAQGIQWKERLKQMAGVRKSLLAVRGGTAPSPRPKPML